MPRRIRSLVVLTLVVAVPAVAQRDWNAPAPAHHVIDNAYFVGTEQLGDVSTLGRGTPSRQLLDNILVREEILTVTGGGHDAVPASCTESCRVWRSRVLIVA